MKTAIIASNESWSGKFVRPKNDRGVKKTSSIDFAISISLVHCIASKRFAAFFACLILEVDFTTPKFHRVLGIFQDTFLVLEYIYHTNVRVNSPA